MTFALSSSIGAASALRPLRKIVLVASLLAAGCSSAPTPRGPLASDDSAEARRTRVRAGWEHRLAENTQGVEAELRAALASDPADASALSLLSKVLYDSDRHEEAVDLLQPRMQDAEPIDELLAALALHYEALERYEESDRIADGLQHRLSRWESAGPALTFVRLRGEKFAQSMEAAESALAANPASAVNHNNLGIAHLYAGDPVAARKEFLTALEIDESLPGPLYNLTIVDRFYFFDDAAARDWFARYQLVAREDPDGLAEVLAQSPLQMETR